ncbi:unnamed protein product [Medioppia subpectinata]|uniref:Small ribosomal subunit protein uS15m n=1 Tax=Medioppia subpectinata TaxID=1979941 RepID=A0A7R9KVG8_9ACAR|nr:unnamed protein product [Medioppia subpectinata]CAG2109429.1 unnamed protein product [Medioppia subpectinata]
MITLRTALSANQSALRHQFIVSNNKPVVSALLDREWSTDRPVLVDKCSTGFPVIISKRFGRRYRKWYHWPNDFLPFYWERQRYPGGHMVTGDQVQDIGTWDKNALILDAKYCKALDDAPEVVRRQFTLEFAHRKDIVKYQRYHIMKAMQRHPMDVTSPEARITDYTVKIRNFLHHFIKVNPYAERMKIISNGLNLKRAKMLKELFYMDRERFHFVTKTLKIDYTPPVLGEMYVKPTRKGELRRLTREYCDKIKTDKLEAYHQKLLAEQREFEASKESMQKWIKDEEKFLGLTVPQTAKPAPT